MNPTSHLERRVIMRKVVHFGFPPRTSIERRILRFHLRLGSSDLPPSGGTGRYTSVKDQRAQTSQTQMPTEPGAINGGNVRATEHFPRQ
jgi:hypothetical protein